MAYAAKVMRGLDHRLRAQPPGAEARRRVRDHVPRRQSVAEPPLPTRASSSGSARPSTSLAAVDASLAEVVDLKFFCGFSFAEIAAMRGVSERTVQRRWEKARHLPAPRRSGRASSRDGDPSESSRRPMNLERWQVLSPYLDRALEMAEDERDAWLASLRADDPASGAELAKPPRRAERPRAGKNFLEPRRRAPPAMPSLAGQQIGAYTLVSPIGQGGMGSVWLARRSDGRFEGQAAVKLLNVSLVGRAGEARFEREGSIPRAPHAPEHRATRRRRRVADRAALSRPRVRPRASRSTATATTGRSTSRRACVSFWTCWPPWRMRTRT